MASSANSHEPTSTGPPPDEIESVNVLLVRGLLFLSSYAPLLAILAIRFDEAALRLVCAGLSVLGCSFLLFILVVVAGDAAARPYPVTAVGDASGQVAGYLATYILPFVAVPSPTLRDLLAYGVWAVVVLAIFLRSELAQINPTLYLFGWRVVSVTIDGSDSYLVCRRVPRPPSDIHAVRAAGLLIRKEG